MSTNTNLSRDDENGANKVRFTTTAPLLHGYFGYITLVRSMVILARYSEPS
jgi:hypothetical protein